MSCSKWAYIPERCDGDFCPGDCDNCCKADDNVALMDGMTTDRAIILLDGLRQCYGWGDVIIHSDDAEALTMAIEALERDRWISVEERLPEMHDEVLVCNEDYGETDLGFATVAVWDGSDWVNTWDRKGAIHCVSHWKPLPEPPKEEEHDE